MNERICLWALLGNACFALTTAWAVEHVTFQRDERQQTVSGTVLVEAADGGLLVMDAARVLWAITPDELIRREQDEVPFASYDRQALADALLAEMPQGFRVHETAHYVICYNTSPAYAEWCGALFERLYLAFRNYWRHRGLKLEDPAWPLVAVVFRDKGAYAAYSRQELGAAVDAIIGYFSLRTNRVIMYDLTGVDGRLPQGISSAARVNQLLSRPQAERTVATIIHEATHQLAFNCGMQTRYADIPLWVSEGIAIYFETPDLGSSRGWRNIGSVNRVRLSDYRRFVRSRPSDSLLTLLSSDERFRTAQTAPDAYAEAWALNYFLIRTRQADYVAYLQALAAKGPLRYDEPAQRLALVRQHFGEDLEQLDQEFRRYMLSVR